jgi:hypothetical protein
MISQPRAEPRGMSLVDLMVAVAGCAVGYFLQPFSLGWVLSVDAYGTGSFGYDSLFGTARRPLLILGFATAAAILVRQVRYGRMPRPAEWALVIAAALVSTAVLDHAYARWLTGASASPWAPDKWRWAAVWSLFALAGLILLITLRRRISPWVWALGLTALAVAWLSGPAHVYFKQATGAPPQTFSSTATWAFQLRWSGWADRGRWPELILFGVPIAVGLRDHMRPGRRTRAWTEWIGLGLGLVLATCWWLDRISLSDPSNPARLANLVVRGFWLGGIGLASWLMIRGSDANWARLIPGAHSPRS